MLEWVTQRDLLRTKPNNRESNLCLPVLCTCLFDAMETVDKKHSGKAMPGKRSKGRPGISFTVQIISKTFYVYFIGKFCLQVSGCIPHVCLVPEEARSGCWILWKTGVTDGKVTVGCWLWNPDLLQEQVFSTTGGISQAPICISSVFLFVNVYSLD